MTINKQAATILLASGLVIGGLGGGVLMTPSLPIAQAAPAAQAQPATAADDQGQAPSYTGSIPVDPAAATGLSEAGEATALQGQATISATEAEAAALAAYPNAKVVKTALDDENGYLVYSVELDNGMDVKVDAGSSAVLATDSGADEAAVAESSTGEREDAGDKDNVQEEHEGQQDDAAETPGVEDAAGQ